MIRTPTDARWLACALADFDRVLVDHAHCEKKASAAAMALVASYPEMDELVRKLSGLAIEELRHFRAVHERLRARGLVLTHPEPDPYAQALLSLVRTADKHRLLDRLLVAGLIEARSHERLALLGENLEDPELRDFYRSLARAEKGHAQLFVELARGVAPEEEVDGRLEELSEAEARIVAKLPTQPRIH